MASKRSGRAAKMARFGVVVAAFAVGWGVNAFVSGGGSSAGERAQIPTISTLDPSLPAATAAAVTAPSTTTPASTVTEPDRPSDTAIPQLPTLPPLNGVSTSSTEPPETLRPAASTTATAPTTATQAPVTTDRAPTTATTTTTTTTVPTTTTTVATTTTARPTTTVLATTTTTTVPTTTTAPPTTLAPLIDPVIESASIESPVACDGGRATTRVGWETIDAVSVTLEADGAVVATGLPPLGNDMIDFACEVGRNLTVAIVAVGPDAVDGRSGATSRVADNVATVVPRAPE